MDNLLKDLNKPQLEAVKNIQEPILVIAGAGSGKTKIIVHKILYLIKHKGVHPSNILAMTFTNKAAKEMKNRVQSILNKNEDIWISTFHSTCAKILRYHGKKIGVSENFLIFDEDDQMTLIRECLQELNLASRDISSNSILSTIQRAKDNFILPDNFEKDAQDIFRKIVSRVYYLYQEKLKANLALDFGDLILQAITLFKKDPKVLSYYQQKFQHILIDEYQDTNIAQNEFLKILSANCKSLCVVGDEDQSIYGWRGANIYNILKFEKEYKGCCKIYLEENYRSTPNILQIANRIVKHNTLRLGKNLYTNKKEGIPPIFYKANNEQEEAWFVTREIIEMVKKNNRKYSDFAVLYRTHAQSRVFEEAFIQSTLPYRIIGGFKFYQRKEIKDIISYLRILVNPQDNLSFKRIINAPLRGIGNVTLQKLEQAAGKNKMSLHEITKDEKYLDCIRPSIKETLIEFNKFLDELNRLKKEKSASELCKIILKKTKYIEELEKEETEESKEKINNLQELIVSIKALEKETSNLTELLEKISVYTEIDAFNEKDNVITLMTLHNAKGLEFPVVFLVGLEEGIFPHWLSLKDEIDLEEERRLCYVGVTRAKEILYLTCSQSRNSYGGVKYNKISRFIEELGIADKDTDRKTTITNIASNKTSAVSRKFIKTDRFAENDRVYHDRWGEGIVVSCEGKGEDAIISVNFVSVGIKKLMLKYAPLQKIT